MKITAHPKMSLAVLTAAAMLSASPTALARDLFVAKTGNDFNVGSKDAPFLTISRAAEKAGPGDTVIVREGVYREWVRPLRGGASEDERIVYQAAKGEDVRIVGSEPFSQWERDGALWIARVPNALFGGFNPFATITRHPIYVEVDESGDGWGWLKYGRDTHLGDVFINGEGLTERQAAGGLETPMSWRAEVNDQVTVITANFGDLDPTEENVEINVRPYAFFPSTPGLSYITFKGFTVMNIASHWAPPTVYQAAAVGTNGGHHWIIEDNAVLNVKGLCVSIGIPTGETDRETFEQRGHHIIRNNALVRCGQGGVAGQLWNNGTLVEGNHVEDVNYRLEFGGWETAGLKFHNGEDMLIRNNFVRTVKTIDPEIGAAHGIWIDYQNKNFRLSKNVIIGAESDAVLIEANWDGPVLLDQNIIVGGRLATASSRGEAWVHNLFIDTTGRWENQDWGNRVPVKHARWFNNIFIGGGLKDAPDEETYFFANNLYLNGAEAHSKETNATEISVSAPHSLEDKKKKVVLTLDLSALDDVATVDAVTTEQLDLPFKETPQVSFALTDDFNGDRRETPTMQGVLSKLKASKTKITLTELNEPYMRARRILSGN